jgi:thiamine transporter
VWINWKKDIFIIWVVLLIMTIIFFSHFVSGIVIWRTFAPEGQTPFVYSLLYNGSYMIMTATVAMLIIIPIQNVVYRLPKTNK